MVAGELEVEFTCTERIERAHHESLFPVEYRIPEVLRGKVHGKRVAIVNDVINAGSAVRGTYADLKACGAKPVAIGTLVTLGSMAAEYAAAINVFLDTIALLPNSLWLPSECPLCAAGEPLEDFLHGDCP